MSPAGGRCTTRSPPSGPRPPSRHPLLRGRAGPIDEQLARPSLPRALTSTIATAESCTGGLLDGPADRAARAPRSTYRGAIVAYSNDVKVAQAGVGTRADRAPRGRLSAVAKALADGARPGVWAPISDVGITGIAGPRRRHRGEARRPRLAERGSMTAGRRLTRSINLPGGRADIRDRATTSRCTSSGARCSISGAPFSGLAGGWRRRCPPVRLT